MVSIHHDYDHTPLSLHPSKVTDPIEPFGEFDKGSAQA